MSTAQVERLAKPVSPGKPGRSTVFWMSSWKTGWTPRTCSAKTAFKRMKKRIQRILEGAHRSSRLREACPHGRNRGRHGKTTKTLKDDKGDLPVEIPRDREGSFDPKLIRKYQTRWPDFDDKIISMYARGMSTRHPGPYRRPRGVSICPNWSADHRRRDRRGPGLAVAASGPGLLSCSWMPCSSRYVIAAAYGTRQSTWPWALTCAATRNSWGSGSSRTKGQSSGSTY